MFHEYVSFGVYGQWIVGLMATVCALTNGQLFSWPAAALPKIYDGSAGFTLTEDEAAWMVTITFVGNVISPIPAGYLMDRIGRRNSLSVMLLVAIASWFILAFTRSFEFLLVARFMSGVWGGVIYTVVPPFLGEVVDPSIRGSISAIFGVMLYTGALYESLASYFDYQVFVLISAVPPTLLFFGFLFVPESPYYHLKNGNRDSARDSIVWLRGSCKEEDLDVLQERVEEQLQMKGSFSDILRTKAARKAFVIVEFLQAAQRSSGVTFLFAYATVVIPDSFITAKDSFLVLTIVWIVFSLVSSTIIDRFNRRTLLSVSCIGSGLSMCAATVWYYMRDFTAVDTTSTDYLPLVFLVLSGIFYSMGIVSIPTLIQSELFPVNIKSKGSALACITANVVSGLNTKFFYDVNSAIGVYFNFLIMGVSPLICVIFIYTVMIETKGKSLETIQDILNERKDRKPKKSAEVEP